MLHLHPRTWSWPQSEHGQALVEYAMLLALVALALIATLTVMGTQVVELYSAIDSAIGALI